MSDVLVTAVAEITKRCRDLKRNAGVQFTIDTTLREVTAIRVVTTERPITVTLTGASGEKSRTQQPNLDNTYDVSVDIVTVEDGGTRGFVWPFTVQF